MSFKDKFDENSKNVKNNKSFTHRFLLTINTNNAYTTQEEALNAKKQLLGVLRRFMQDMESFIRIYKSKTNRKKVDVEFKNIAKDIDVNVGVEIGHLQKRLHTHIEIKWETLDPYFFQFSQTDINNWFKQRNLNYYVNIKWIADVNNVFRYIKKDQ